MALKKRKKDQVKSLIDFHQTANTEHFMEELRVMSSAAVGVVIIRTREFHRAVGTLFEFAVSKGDTAFHIWTITEGWKPLSTTAQLHNVTPTNQSIGNRDFQWDPVNASVSDHTPEPSNEGAETDDTMVVFDLYPEGVDGDRSDINGGMDALLNRISANKENEHSINVLMAPDYALESPGFQEYIRAFLSKSYEIDARLMLVCHDSVEIPERLFEETRVIDYLPPNAAELYNFVDEVLEVISIGGDDDVTIEMSTDEKQRIVQNALGMSYAEFTTALSVALVKQDAELRDGEDVDIDRVIQTVLDTKVEIIKKNQILEMLEPIDISQVGGLDLLKGWIEDRKKAFSPEAREYGIDMPKGILCAGAPGTGKSLIAKSIASVLRIPAISLDIGKVFGGLVGQSEGQMRSTLKTVEAMAPVVLLMDEIDKGFSNTSGGGDSGTSARVFGTFLTWMQERKSEDKPVFVVMTANNVEHLPPELLRKGRLDEIFAVSFPDQEEREAILRIHFSKRGHDLPDEDIKRIAEITPHFVGAELEATVKDTLLNSFNRGLAQPTVEVATEVANGIIPLYKTFGDKIKRMNTWAINNAKPASSHYNFSTQPVKTSPRTGTVSRGPAVRRKPKTFKPRSTDN